MGRAQKLKKKRKEEKYLQAVQRNKSRQMMLTTIVAVIVIVVGGFWLNNWYKQKSMNKQSNYQAVIHTNKGDIKLALDKEVAPKTVENFVGLSKNGYYDQTTFHRVIKEFMIQGGDPLSKDDDLTNDGTGGESLWGEKFEDEINPKSLGLNDEEIASLEGQGYVYNYELNSLKVDKGVIAMANSGPNTNGSQFFIVTEKEQPHLNGKHTVFGRVIEGMETVLAIASVEVDGGDQPKEKVIINSIEILETQEDKSLEDEVSKPAESDSSVPISIQDVEVKTEGDGIVNIEKVE